MVFSPINKNNSISPNYSKTHKTENAQASSTTSKVPTDSLSLSNAAKDAASTESALKGFLAKIANGTATGDDLKKMQSLLKTAPQNLSSGIGSKVGFKGNESDLKSFLAKVANGTVTSDDLKKMQTESQIKEQPVSSDVDNAAVNNIDPTLSSISQKS